MVRRRWDFLLARGLQRGRACCRPASTASTAPAIAAGGAATGSRAATSSITNWWCRRAGTCSTSRAAAGATRASSQRRSSWPRRATRRSSATWTRGRPRSKATCSPNTYRLSRHTTPERLCRMMTGKFREAWREPAHRRRRARHGHAGVAGGEGGQAGRGAPADRRRVREPPAHRNEARLRPDHDLRRAAREAATRRDSPQRPRQRSSVQYLPPRRPAARADRQPRPGVASARRWPRRTSIRCTSWRAPTAPAATNSPALWPRTKARWSGITVRSGK